MGAFVLTIFERLTFKQLPFYLELMRHLSRRGLPVPAPQENRSGALLSEIKGKPAAIVTRLEGEGRHRAERSALRTGGRGAGERCTSPARTSRCSSRICAASAGGRNRCRSSKPHIPDHVFHRLADELIYQDTFFRSARFERLPAGPIHADLFRDNVLMVKNGAGDAIGGLIDFYFAGCSLWSVRPGRHDERLVHQPGHRCVRHGASAGADRRVPRGATAAGGGA